MNGIFCLILLLVAAISEGCAMRQGHYQTLIKKERQVVHFHFAKADIRDEDRAFLHKLSDVMQHYPQSVALLEGHTDMRGSNKYNEVLAEYRARAVGGYLLQLGTSDHQLTFVSKGKREPVVQGNTPEAHQANRRVEIQLTLVYQVQKKGKQMQKQKRRYGHNQLKRGDFLRRGL